jgi:hypothetical protein
MFAKLIETVKRAEFKQKVTTVAVNVAIPIMVGIGIKVVTYIAIEGTKALIEEIANRNNEVSAE